jgi:hypothetical protein
MCHLTTLYGCIVPQEQYNFHNNKNVKYLHNELMHTHPSLMLLVSFPAPSITFLEILSLLNPCIPLEGDIQTVGTSSNDGGFILFCILIIYFS